MTQPVTPSSTMVTFVVRFWRVVSGGELRWRGQIEHVQSGQNAAFLDMDAMLRFLHRFGFEVEEPRSPAPDKR